MATRFKITSDATAPAVSPTAQSYTHSSINRRKLLTSDSSSLTTAAYTPDAADHLVAGDACALQYVSNPMSAGIAFNNAQTIKMAIQLLEANAANNLFLQLFVSIVSEDGGTVRRTLRSKVADGTELNTSIQNRFHSTTQDGASYTTVNGDRLVVEFGVTGTPTGAGGVQGHNSSARTGGGGAGGDLGENDTDTGTTLNPWIEFVPTIIFRQDVTGGTIATTAINAPTVKYQVVNGTIASGSALFAPTVRYRVVGGTISTTTISAPTVRYRVVGGTIAGTALFAPTVEQAGGAQAVTSGTVGAGTVNAPTVAYRVAAPSISPGTAVNAPAAAYRVVAAAIAAGTVLFAPTTAYAVTAGTRASEAAANAPTLRYVVVGGATISTTTLGAPRLGLDLTPTTDPITGTPWPSVAAEDGWADVKGRTWPPIPGGRPWDPIS